MHVEYVRAAHLRGVFADPACLRVLRWDVGSVLHAGQLTRGAVQRDQQAGEPGVIARPPRNAEPSEQVAGPGVTCGGPADRLVAALANHIFTDRGGAELVE